MRNKKTAPCIKLSPNTITPFKKAKYQSRADVMQANISTSSNNTRHRSLGNFNTPLPSGGNPWAFERLKIGLLKPTSRGNHRFMGYIKKANEAILSETFAHNGDSCP